MLRIAVKSLAVMQTGRVPSTHLALSRLPLMARHSNLIKKVVKLSNDGCDLRGQVAGIHIPRGQ